MDCKTCGMKYDGPTDRFPKSGFCPLCDPANASALAEEAELLERFRQADLELAESTRQALADGEIQR